MNEYNFNVGDYLIAKYDFVINDTGVTFYFYQGCTYKVLNFHDLSYTTKKGISIAIPDKDQPYSGCNHSNINFQHLINFDTLKYQRKMKLKKLKWE